MRIAHSSLTKVLLFLAITTLLKPAVNAQEVRSTNSDPSLGADHGRLPEAAPRLESLPGAPPARPSLATESSEWTVVARDYHQQTWTASERVRDGRTGRVTTRRKEIIEVGSGLNYRDNQGQWHPTVEAFEITCDGHAVARFGPHKLIISPNLNSVTAIDFLAADGVRLQSGPLAICFRDPVNGASVVLATVRDAGFVLTAPNEITFRSAFDGLDADVRITYRRAGMSSDLILRQVPPDPAQYGLSAESRLEFITEFAPQTPIPRQTARLLRREANAGVRQRMVDPDFIDHLVDFGDYKMGTGTAFDLAAGQGGARGVPVGKVFTTLDNRPALIEAIEWSAAKPLLAGLPPARRAGDMAQRAAPARIGKRTLPERRLAGRPSPSPLNGERAGVSGTPDSDPARTATALASLNSTPQTGNPERAKQGFLIDYSLVTGATNVTFSS